MAATKKCLNQDFHKIYKITKIFLLLNPVTSAAALGSVSG